MGRISILDDNMTNMIAAGEVIERPASVVKELVENGIDAGATNIDISVEDGGKRLIAVADDGCGMDAQDLSLAFEPHSTSKIRTRTDLGGISTLGFRGEALASIGAVAQVRAVSRQKAGFAANCIEIDSGRKGPVQPCSGDEGTRIEVRGLFYRLPARRKFLKSANTEFSHITEQFIRLSLGNKQRRLSLSHNGKELYRVDAADGIRQRIEKLFSAHVLPTAELVETQSCQKDIAIHAVLGKPSISKTSGKLQYIFLNGRFIRDRFISHAVRQAYRGHIEAGRFPVVFLFIEMPYDNYDVNVHPTKIEVRFYDPNLVHSQILGTLRDRLLGTGLQTTGMLSEKHPNAVPHSEQIRQAMSDFFKQYGQGSRQQRMTFRKSGPSGPAVETAPAGGADITKIVTGRSFLQIHNSYIVLQEPDGFVIIDQHALHERIIYEQLRSRVSQAGLQSQKLLIPESFDVTASQAEMLKGESGLLERLGIEIVQFGPRTMAIQSFPGLLSRAEPAEFMRDFLDLLEQRGVELEAEGLLDDILKMAACRAAIKAGQSLSDAEIEQLLSDRDNTGGCEHCPHGRPTTIKFTTGQLERQFKRS